MRVKIFTEGGNGIGIGHLSRCSSLYDEVKSRGLEVEFIVYGNVERIEFLKGKIIKNINWLSEDYLTNSIENTDYCIVDSYLAPKGLYQIISNKAKKALYIDDNARIEYPKGIIVNPSLNVDDTKYSKKNENIYLLGAKNIILRSPFLNFERNTLNKDVKEVLITMGGSDIRTLTPRILTSICTKYPNIKFNAVIGNTLHNTEICDNSNLENVELYYNVDAELMKKLMIKSDFAITAAGQTIYELLSTHTAFIPIKVIDNQNNNIEGLKKLNPDQIAIEYSDELFVEHLEQEFISMLNLESRKTFIHQYLNCIDGLGRKRIIDKLILFSEGEIILPNIVFCGFEKLGKDCLEELLKNGYQVKYILTHEQLESESVDTFAIENKIIYSYKDARLNLEELSNIFNTIKPKYLVSVNYRYILPKVIFQIAKYAINIHGSLLPKYRGRTPHVWSIINGEKICGITSHILEENVDSGDIVEQKTIDIEIDDTGYSLLNKYQKQYPTLLIDSLKKLEKGVVLKKQNNDNASYYGKRTPDMGYIDFNKEFIDIINFVRAQAEPYPGAYYYLIDGRKIIINKLVFDESIEFTGLIGTIKNIDNSYYVKCKDANLKIIDYRIIG